MFFISGILSLYADTRVVVLGSGNPNPDPFHSGCSIAVVVDDVPYIVDCGPGLVRNAAAISPQYGGSIKGLAVEKIKRLFITHLHSDHTAGLPDVMLTPWVMGRDEPLQVYGPEGLKDMTAHITEAYEQDIHYRLFGTEPANNQGWKAEAHEISEGVVYSDERVTVEAFQVKHGTWPAAYGFRFTTKDKVIVVSGDTAPCDNIQAYAENADILVHEVYYKKGFDSRSDDWKEYHAAHHTSTVELAQLAAKTQPGLVILYHVLYWGASDQDLLDEMAPYYNGPVEVGKDCSVY